MNRLRLIPFLLLPVLFCYPLLCKNLAITQKNDSINVRKVAQEVAPVHISISLIKRKTKLEITKKGGRQVFDLHIPKGFEFVKSQEAENSRYLVYVYEYEVFDGGNSKVLIIDKIDLKLILQKELRGFNISQPLIEDDFVYLAVSGYASKLKLSDGVADWELLDLTRKYEFDGVLDGESIEIRGNTVFFGPNFSYNQKNKIIKSKGSGQ